MSLKTAKFQGEFLLELGGSLQDVEIVYEEWGPKRSDKVVLLFPSFSMSSHAKSTVEDPTAGWYEHFVGPRKGIDTDVYRVICAANLGSPFGSTSPKSINPSTGKPYGKDFPQITPFDIARATQMLLAQHLEIPQLCSVIGGSLGGNLTLEFCSLFPDYSESAIAMCCTGKTSPLSVGLRHIQRAAITSDPEYCDGDYEIQNRFPHSGLSIARQLAMLVYKSWDAFNTRFDWEPRAPYGFKSAKTFDIESFLTYQGQKFSGDVKTAYDPNCYLLLSKASDLTDLKFRGSTLFPETAAQLNESYLDAVLRLKKTKLLLFGVTSDIVIPIGEQREIYSILRSVSSDTSNVEFDVSSSIFGHDAFILDESYFIPKIRAFMKTVHSDERHERARKKLCDKVD